MVVYDTVSPMKLTAKVAETIHEALKEKGVAVDSFYVKDVDHARVKDYECLIAGGPKMYFRASKGIMEFLDSFHGKEFSGKFATAFDTEVKSGMGTIGNATKTMESKLGKLGFEIVSPSLKVYVEGKMNSMQLKEGELEKAKKWAEEVAKALSK